MRFFPLANGFLNNLQICHIQLNPFRLDSFLVKIYFVFHLLYSVFQGLNFFQEVFLLIVRVLLNNFHGVHHESHFLVFSLNLSLQLVNFVHHLIWCLLSPLLNLSCLLLQLFYFLLQFMNLHVGCLNDPLLFLIFAVHLLDFFDKNFILSQ
jgi:hypothetical protein